MEQTVNWLLYKSREDRGLSVKEAAKLLKVPAIILKRLEYGYWRVGKRLLARAGEAYGIERELALATQAYVAPLPEKPKRKLIHKDFSLLAMIGSFAGLLISIALIILSIIGNSFANYNNLELYGDNFRALHSYVEDCEYGYVSYEGEYGTLNYETTQGIIISKAVLIRSYVLNDGNEVSLYTTAENYPCDNVVVTFNFDEEFFSCTCHANFDDNGTLRSFECSDDLFGAEIDFEVSSRFEEKVKEIYREAISDFNAFYDSIELNANYQMILLEEYSAIKEVTTVYIWSAIGLCLVPVALVCLAVLCVITTAKFIKKRKAIKAGISLQTPTGISLQTPTEDAQTVSEEKNPPLAEAEAAVSSGGELSDNPPIVKSRIQKIAEHITPLIHENVLRIVGIIMLALGSLVPYLTYIKIFGGISEGQANFITSAVPYLKTLVPAATVLLFFTRIDILTYRKSYKFQLLQYGIIGTLFYYEIVLMILLTGLVNNREILQMLASVLPGNIFLGMFAYTLIALFLFYTPGRIKTKRAITLWRCLSILPLAYVLVGTFVIPFLELTPIVTELFFSNSIVPSLSAVGYIYVRFIFNKVQNKSPLLNGVGELRSKKIMSIRNITACAVISLVILIQYLFSLNEATVVLSSGDSAIALIVLPFIVLYQPRLEPRSKVQDAIFGVLYGIAFFISYILIALTPLSRELLKLFKNLILR